jgi:hypothetical protein
VRPLSSVVLPEGRAEAILEDCREFLESEEWYAHVSERFWRCMDLI